MALGSDCEILVAPVEHAHGTPGLAREQRRMAGDDGRVLLLAAEPSARLALDDARLLGRDPEGARERLLDVVRTLQRAADEDRSVRPWWPGHAALCLDVELLLAV